jgi:hypothetical protein
MSELLVSPVMVQANLAPGAVYDTCAPHQAYQGYANTIDARLIEEAMTVAAIRKTRDTNAQRVLTISGQGIDANRLDPPRSKTWELASTIVNQHVPEADMYLLRDQRQYTRARHADIDVVRLPVGKAHVRSEEGLLPRAEAIIEDAKIAATKNTNRQVMLCEQDADCIVRCNQSQSQTHIPLRGYTFNSHDVAEGDRTVFSYYPSCAVFLAATALEQIELASHTVRIFSRTIKNRDYDARTLVQLKDNGPVPIDSVSVGDDGKINKMFSWHTDKQSKEFIRTIVRAAAA